MVRGNLSGNRPHSYLVNTVHFLSPQHVISAAAIEVSTAKTQPEMAPSRSCKMGRRGVGWSGWVGVGGLVKAS